MLMNLPDEQYTQTSFYGVPKMTAWLRRQGHQINPKRIRRLNGIKISMDGRGRVYDNIFVERL